MPGDGYCLTFMKDFCTVTMVNWDETKERLKQKINIRTEGNLLLAKEKQEELLSRLEAKLGQPREAIIKIISKL